MRCPVFDYLDAHYRGWLAEGDQVCAQELKERRDRHRAECPACRAQTAELTEAARNAVHPELVDEPA